MSINGVDFGSLERIWAERAQRVAQLRNRADPRGMTRPARDPVERAWLERRGQTGTFVEVERLRADGTCRGGDGEARSFPLPAGLPSDARQ